MPRRPPAQLHEPDGDGALGHLERFAPARVNVVGVCHSVRDTHAFLARTVGVPEPRVEFRTAGFNRNASSTCSARESGEDLYPRLRAIVEADPEGLGRRVRVELFKRFGYFPTESSEHSAEYVPWFLSHDEQVERYRIEVDEYLRRSEDNLAEWEAVKRALDAGEELEVERNDELASQFVRALETGAETELYGNVRNDGSIESPRRRVRRGSGAGRSRRRRADAVRRSPPNAWPSTGRS